MEEWSEREYGKVIVVIQTGLRSSRTVSVRPRGWAGEALRTVWHTRKGSEREKKSLLARLRAEKRNSRVETGILGSGKEKGEGGGGGGGRGGRGRRCWYV